MCCRPTLYNIKTDKHPIKRPMTAHSRAEMLGGMKGRRRWRGHFLVGGTNERYRKEDAAAPSPSYLTPPSPRIKTTGDVRAGKHPAVCARPREGPIENGESVQKAAMHGREARLSAGT